MNTLSGPARWIARLQRIMGRRQGAAVSRSRAGRSKPPAAAFRALLLAGLLAGCAQATVSIPDHQRLPLEGAIVVPAPTNRTGKPLDVPGADGFDLLVTLQRDIEEAMHLSCFVLADPERSVYRLETDVIRYEPGNAFKRWLLPGYGATELAVTSALVRARDGVSVAEVQAKGDISAGGLYTLGGYRSVAWLVGSEIAQSLRRKTEGRRPGCE